MSVATEPFYTVATLAARLAVNPKTVRRLLDRGEIPSVRIGTSVRVDPADVDAYVARNRKRGRSA